MARFLMPARSARALHGRIQLSDYTAMDRLRRNAQQSGPSSRSMAAWRGRNRGKTIMP